MPHHSELGETITSYTITKPDRDSPGGFSVIFKAANEGSEFRERATLVKLIYSDNRLLTIDLGHNFLQGNTGRIFLSPQVKFALTKKQGSYETQDLGLMFQNGVEGVNYQISGQGNERLFKVEDILRRPTHMRLFWEVTDNIVVVTLDHLPSSVQKIVKTPIDIDPLLVLAGSEIKVDYQGPFRGFLNAFLFESLSPRQIIRPTDVSRRVEWLLQRANLLDIVPGEILEEQFLELFDHYNNFVRR